ncbi:MAG: hypothetical protein MZV70_50880 [Desulfobacterales bacterium]|nr:hypothetical protein [Desulfobacterales bacterium]
MDGWINANLSALRTAAKLPEIVCDEPRAAGAGPEGRRREYPWMYLVFTVGAERHEHRPQRRPAAGELRRSAVFQGRAWPARPSAGRRVIGRTSNVAGPRDGRPHPGGQPDRRRAWPRP